MQTGKGKATAMKNARFTCGSCSAGSGRQRDFRSAAKTILQWTEAILFLFGLVLLVCYAAARIESYLISRAALTTFERLDEPPESAGDRAPQKEIAAEEPDFKDWDAGRVRAYKDSLWKRTGTPLAVLEIPSIHLAAPLLEGTDSLTLNHALGRIAGTARPGEPGNIGIAGHRDSFFRGLKDLKPGDTVELRTRAGKDIYMVDRTQTVTPRDVSVLDPEEQSSLTLVTCYPFYFVGSAPRRFVVTAYLTEHRPAGQSATDARLDSQPRSSTQEEQ
jgi:sortase A